MAGKENRRSVNRYFEAVSTKDFAALSELRHERFVQEWPQMNERTRGKENARLINENHPGLPRAKVKRIMGGDDYWVAETHLTYWPIWWSRWTGRWIIVKRHRRPAGREALILLLGRHLPEVRDRSALSAGGISPGRIATSNASRSAPGSAARPVGIAADGRPGARSSVTVRPS
jgi:hypothetical protein